MPPGGGGGGGSIGSAPLTVGAPGGGNGGGGPSGSGSNSPTRCLRKASDFSANDSKPPSKFVPAVPLEMESLVGANNVPGGAKLCRLRSHGSSATSRKAGSSTAA